MEQEQHYRSAWLLRTRRLVGGFALASVALTGCSASTTESASPATSNTATSKPVTHLTGTLNYDGLTSNNTCQGGAARPCFAPIRRKPQFAAPGEDATASYLNAGTFDSKGKYLSITWPYEPSPQRPAGDALDIVCRVAGVAVYGVDHAQSSSVWDVVAVPPEHSRTGKRAYGYAPERWIQFAANETGTFIASCDTITNLAGSPVVTTPIT